MTNKDIRTFEVAVNRDELGEPEELTWDLIPVISPSETKHLDEHGLPKVATKLKPGMILVGKIGKTRAYSKEPKPTDLELHTLSFEELHDRFGHLWADTSERVPPMFHGEVVESKLETRENGGCVAVVRVRMTCDCTT